MDERSAPRVPVDLHADVYLEGRTLRVYVYDLSVDGCALESGQEDLPPRDTVVALFFPDGPRIAGKLMWTIGRNGGVRFSEAPPPELVAHLGLPSEEPRHTFRDQFGRALFLPGQRFDVAR